MRHTLGLSPVFRRLQNNAAMRFIISYLRTKPSTRSSPIRILAGYFHFADTCDPSLVFGLKSIAVLTPRCPSHSVRKFALRLNLIR